MAVITRKGTASSVSGNTVIIGEPTVITLSPPPTTYVGSGLIAGEALDPGAACFIANDTTNQKASDGSTAVIAGRVYMAAATQYHNAVHGYNEKQVFAAGEACTLRKGVDWDYIDSGFTAIPGAPIYLSATRGKIANTTTATYGTTVIGTVLPKNSDNTANPTAVYLRDFLQ